MKPNELRIGNKLQKDNGDIFTVRQLDSKNDVDILVEEQPSLLTLDYNLFPIPLTPEWLERMGFTLRSKGIKSKSGLWQLNIDDYYFIVIYQHPGVIYKHAGSFSFEVHNQVEDYRDFIGLPNNPQHVHQLQNLYFALTGEELTIKEKTL